MRAYGNHPSFVMLSFGNELQAGALGHKRMDLLLKAAVERVSPPASMPTDPTPITGRWAPI